MGTLGDRIENPMDLFKYKSVYVKQWNRHSPTAFLISMQFNVLAGFMMLGIYQYTAEPKVKREFIDAVQWKKK